MGVEEFSKSAGIEQDQNRPFRREAGRLWLTVGRAKFMEDLRMRKEARPRAAEVSPAIAKKMKEFAELIASERFGTLGVPKEITFSEI
jgi:hypothetical protein